MARITLTMQRLTVIDFIDSGEGVWTEYSQRCLCGNTLESIEIDFAQPEGGYLPSLFECERCKATYLIHYAVPEPIITLKPFPKAEFEKLFPTPITRKWIVGTNIYQDYLVTDGQYFSWPGEKVSKEHSLRDVVPYTVWHYPLNNTWRKSIESNWDNEQWWKDHYTLVGLQRRILNSI